MKKNRNIYLLSHDDVRKISLLVTVLEKALAELIELKRVTTLDDQRPHCPPHECDLFEQASFISYDLEHLENKKI